MCGFAFASKIPPECYIKPVSGRKKMTLSKRKQILQKDRIRTDFVLQNVFAYLLKDEYPFNAMCSENVKEQDALRKIKETIDIYAFVYAEAAKQYCLKVGPLNGDVLEEVLSQNFNGIFRDDGIDKNRIMGFFILTGELCKTCLMRKDVDIMYLCFSKHVKRKLKRWIYDHGGWVCIQYKSDFPKMSFKKALFLFCTIIFKIFYLIPQTYSKFV